MPAERGGASGGRSAFLWNMGGSDRRRDTCAGVLVVAETKKTYAERAGVRDSRACSVFSYSRNDNKNDVTLIVLRHFMYSLLFQTSCGATFLSSRFCKVTDSR